MLFILLTCLITMLFIAYVKAKKDILSPWIMLISMFLISTIVAIMNISRWEQDIHLETLLIIILSLIFFGLGELIANKTSISKNTTFTDINYELIGNGERVVIKIFPIVIISSLMFVVTYEYFLFIFKVSLMQGNPGDYSIMLDYARAAFSNLDLDTTPSSLLQHGLLISKCFAYFFIFICIYNTIFFKFRIWNILYLMPGAIYIIQAVLSTGRTQIMDLIMYVLIVNFILWKKKNNWSNSFNLKIIRNGLLGIIIFLIIFRFLGSVAGKVYVSNQWDNFSIYIGSSIIALDKYIQSPQESMFWGSETLYGIYGVLRKLGMNIPKYVKQLEFVSWGEYHTNLYTALRRYIQDYTIAGCFLITFLLGILYSSGLKYIKKKKKISLPIIYYAMFLTPILEFSMEERFFTGILALNTIYTIVYMNIIWLCFITRKILKNKINNL